jgi:hypothetical protein
MNGNPQEDPEQTEGPSYLDLVPCGSSEDAINVSEKKLIIAEPSWKVPGGDCEAVFDAQDSCVSCVEGVTLQHEYERNSAKPFTLVDRVLPDGGPPLTRHEAAIIRLLAMEQQQQRVQASNPAEMDILSLNLCGTDSGDIDDEQARSKRVVSPDVSGVGALESEPLVHATTVFEETKQDKSEEGPHCAVCLDEVIPNSAIKVPFAKLPCCGQANETNTFKICSACVVLLTQPTSDGSSRAGRCPCCRSWIVVRAPDGNSPLNLDISTVAAAGTCKECNQSNKCLVDDGDVCDACFLGHRNPLLYECDQCHGTQRIPHPMYRYQQTPGDFGKKTWSCEGPCQTFTHWRIRHDQIIQVPIGDSPWRENSWITSARQRIEKARRELQVEKPSESECCIL